MHICDDKYTTVKFLEKEGFSAPKSILPNEEEIDNFIESVGYPFIIKTRSGNGAKEVFLAKSYNDYAPYIGNENYMFQEYIPSEGGEYTSGIYLGDDGEVKGICTLERELRCGSTYKAKRIDNEVLEEPLKKIATSLGMKYLNIQSMRKGDILYPFEFNGRFSGTTGIITGYGIVRGIDTSAFVSGDVIFLSDTVPGTFVKFEDLNSKCSRANRIGRILATGITDGSIYVNILNENEINLDARARYLGFAHLMRSSNGEEFLFGMRIFIFII